MSPSVLLTLFAVLSAGVAFVVISRGSRWTLPRVRNYRGESLPVVLGMAVTTGVVVGVLVALVADLRRGRILPSVGGTVQLVGSIVMVFAAGLFDDAQTRRVRGFVAHGRALARGRPTSGILKLVAIVVAAAIAVRASRGLSVQAIVGVLFIAGSANLWNLFDVAPGRSIKSFLVAAVALQVAVALLSPCATCGFSVFVLTGLAAALVALPFDLREHAMLGDGGANVLGFLLGVGLFLRLSTAWLWAAFGAVLLLTALGETVTLSRSIRAVPPLRWFDDLGRVRHPTEDRTQAPHTAGPADA
jgi:UDP-GlcNAc:undecaprenyl-phosphate GlcNAc-1-phosphate transferase